MSLAQVDKVDGPGGQSTPKQERGGDKGWGKVPADRFGDVPARLSWLMDNARDAVCSDRHANCAASVPSVSATHHRHSTWPPSADATA